MALTRVLSLANNRAALFERAMHVKSLLKLHAYAKVSKRTQDCYVILCCHR
jgi:hypothetical protein